MQGAAAKGFKRRLVSDEATLADEVPAWMKVKETDSEKVKEKKRRNLKAYKKTLKCAAARAGLRVS